MLKEMFKKTKYISLNEGGHENKEQDSHDAKKVNYEENVQYEQTRTNNYVKLHEEKKEVNKTNRFHKKNNEKKSLLRRSNKEKEDIPYKNVDNGPSVPNGMWIKCERCGEILYSDDVSKNYYCCPLCKFHFRINATKRLYMIIDDKSFKEWEKNKYTKNVLDFPKYEEKIEQLKIKTGIEEAVITGMGTIHGYKTAVAIMDSSFLMGSMGQVVGEKITRAIEKATQNRLPIIIFSSSGGARMQEGIISLMQMAKTSAAIKRHSKAGLLYISVLTDPTTGGVTASFAMLGDIILAEPGALIGFAGPRVIEQTIGQKLPEGFQRSEFLMEKGFIDRIVSRIEMKEELANLLSLHKAETK